MSDDQGEPYCSNCAMSDDQGEPYCSNCGRAGRHCASCDDQDTTAPGRVNAAAIQERLTELLAPYAGEAATKENKAAMVRVCAEYLASLAEDRPRLLEVTHCHVGHDGVAHVEFRCDPEFYAAWKAAQSR